MKRETAMKHRIKVNKLGRKAQHRVAMLRNMTTSLLRHERIKTTIAKAKELRKVIEKMITRAKVDSVHNRRIIAKNIKDKAILAKLFTDIGPRFADRLGGYTRILKLGQRTTDATEMVFIELIDRVVEEKKEKAVKKEKAKAPTA